MEWKAAGGQGAGAGDKASEGLGEGKDKTTTSGCRPKW